MTTAAAAENPQPERVDIIVEPENGTVEWQVLTSGNVVVAVEHLNRTGNYYGYVEYNATECPWEDSGCRGPDDSE